VSNTTIAWQAQGIHAGEVIAKLTENAYFMRVDNRVTEVPPPRLELMKPDITKLLVTTRQTTDATVTMENKNQTKSL
jgi:hypothetical protein